jgi:hypothetical protein
LTSPTLLLGIDLEPVEIILPNDAGLTLRHYREADDGQEPVFLGRDGVVYAFRSPEGLVAFLRSGEPHDLADLPNWEEISAAADIDVTPDEMGVYHLDMVVEMLRAGPDSWDHEMLVLAGEAARDIGKYAGLNDVLTALAPGSPLDALDDDLRDGGFLARRRLRKRDADSAAIGWRSLIGRLTPVIEFRD